MLCVNVCAHVSFLFLSLLNFSLTGEDEGALPLHDCRSLPKNTRLPHHLHPDLQTILSNDKEHATGFLSLLTLPPLVMVSSLCFGPPEKSVPGKAHSVHRKGPSIMFTTPPFFILHKTSKPSRVFLDTKALIP